MTYFFFFLLDLFFGNVAQSVEQHPFKVMVPGSIPGVPTKYDILLLYSWIYRKEKKYLKYLRYVRRLKEHNSRYSSICRAVPLMAWMVPGWLSLPFKADSSYHTRHVSPTGVPTKFVIKQTVNHTFWICSKCYNNNCNT